MPKISIIIVNYNSWCDTIECLESLKKITYTNYHILIIDNNSSDASVKHIEDFLKKNQKLQATSYKLQANVGFAGGNNVGIGKALKKDAAYVLLLNPDTIVEPDFLDGLVDVAEVWREKGKLAFFGPRIYLQATSYKLQDQKIYSNGGIINWSRTKGILKDYGKRVSEVEEKKPFVTDYVSGTCMLVSGKIIEQIGLMKEDYFLYYEDTDWAIRARRKGIVSVIVPQSIIWHKMSTSTKEGSPSYIYYHVRNGLYCGWRNGGTLQKATVAALSIWTFIKQPVKLLIPHKRHWAKPVMKGVLDFWRGKAGKATIS